MIPSQIVPWSIAITTNAIKESFLTLLLLQRLAWRHGGAHMRLREQTTAGAPDPFHMPTIATSSLN